MAAKQKLEEYLSLHGVESKVNDILNRTLRSQPSDPISFMGGEFANEALSLKGIKDFDLFISLDNFARPAVSTRVVTARGEYIASVCCSDYQRVVVEPAPPPPKVEDDLLALNENDERPKSAFDSAEGDENAKWPSLHLSHFVPDMERHARLHALEEALKFFKEEEIREMVIGREPELEQEDIDNSITSALKRRVEIETERIGELKRKVEEEEEAKRAAKEKAELEGTDETKGDDFEEDIGEKNNAPMFDLSEKGVSAAYDELHTKQYTMGDPLELDLMLRHAAFSISIACARAGAAEADQPLFQYVATLANKADELYLPVPMIGVMNGGTLAPRTRMPFEVIHIAPVNYKTFLSAFQAAERVELQIRKVASQDCFFDESESGALAPVYPSRGLTSNAGPGGGGAAVADACMDVVFRAIVSLSSSSDESSDEEEGKDSQEGEEKEDDGAPDSKIEEDSIKMGITCASSVYFAPPTEEDIELERNLSGSYNVSYKVPKSAQNKEEEGEGKLNEEELVTMYRKYVERYPMALLEDPLENEAWIGLGELVEEFGRDVQILANKTISGEKKNFDQAVEAKACNGIVLDLHKVSSLTEALAVADRAQKEGWGVALSIVPGDVDDDFLADLAVGLGAGQIKSPGLKGVENMSKWNRLIEIESLLEGNSEYVGDRFRRPL
eukprot:g635.t1